MKKRYIVGIVIVILILVPILSFIIYNVIVENRKEYKIAEVAEYNYFVLKQDKLSRSD